MALYDQDPSSENCCQRCNYYYCLTFGIILLVLSVTFIGLSASCHGYDAFLYAGSAVLMVAGIFTWCGAGVVLFQYRLLQNKYKCCRFLFYFCYGCCLDDKDKRNCQKDLKFCYICCHKCKRCCSCGSEEADDNQQRAHGNRRNRRSQNNESEIIQIGDDADPESYPDRGDVYIYADGTYNYGRRHSHRSAGNTRIQTLDDDLVLSAILERPRPHPDSSEGMRPGASLHSVLSLPPAYEEPDMNPPPYTNEPPPAYEGEISVPSGSTIV